PTPDYAGALADLDTVEKSLGSLKTKLGEYQKVLDHRADTDTKIDRLEKDPHKNLITAQIAAAKAAVPPALAKAEPPGNDYREAIKALGAVDKQCAAAEVKIFDEQVKGKSRTQMVAAMQTIFKDRFDVDLVMRRGGETQQQELDSIKRLYEL